MAWYNIGDWFSGANTGSTMSQADQQANTARLQAELKAQTDAGVAAGTISPLTATQNYVLINQTLDSTSAAAVSGFVSGLGDAITGGPSGGPGLSSVFKDVLILGATAGAVWLFVNFGGYAWVKAFAKKTKYGWYIVGGAALLVAIGLYALYKKTTTDASGVAKNSFLGPLSFLFGSGSAPSS
jgi:hypothetical protein